MILLITDRHNGTFGCLGPLNDYKVAYSYKDFIESLNPTVDCHLVDVPIRQRPIPGSYPWPIDDYEDGDEG